MKKFTLCIVIFVLAVLPVSSQEEEVRASVGLAMVLNLLPGFGLGSFIQGDCVGGFAQLGAELSAVGIYGIIFYSFFWTIAGQPSLLMEHEAFTTVLAITGTGIFYASKVFGFIRPIRYAAHKKTKLQDERVRISFVPSIAPDWSSQRLAVGVGLTVKFAVE